MMKSSDKEESRRRHRKERRPESGRRPGTRRRRCVNRLVLSARLVERGALRYTPAGLPALDFELKHESEVQRRRPAAQGLDGDASGGHRSHHAVLGGDGAGQRGQFRRLPGSARNGRGLLFHVTARRERTQLIIQD